MRKASQPRDWSTHLLSLILHTSRIGVNAVSAYLGKLDSKFLGHSSQRFILVVGPCKPTIYYI